MARLALDPLGLLPRARGAGAAAADAAFRTGLSGLERALASEPAAALVDVVMRSPAVSRAVSDALTGPVVDEVMQRLLAGGVAERIAAEVLDSPAIEGLVAEVLDSRAFSTGVERVLQTEELWMLIDVIAGSPAVTRAITQQSAGFADQVSQELGRRSRRVDARLETTARRWFRRPPRPQAEEPATT